VGVVVVVVAFMDRTVRCRTFDVKRFGVEHAPGTVPAVTARDHVDELIDRWRAERPDLAPELDAMATFGRLGRATALAGRALDAVFARHGLNVGEFDVLATLRRAGAPYEAKPSAIARSLMLSPAAMTNRLDRLESAGLLERRSVAGDRRSTPVGLTARGLEVVDRAVAEHVANEAALLADLGATQRRELDRGLRALLAALQRHAPE